MIPEAIPAVATPGLPLTQTPPPGVADSVVDVPTHKDIVPVMGAGVAFTVTTRNVVQPVAVSVKITVSIPIERPVNTPDVPSMVPTVTLLVLQVPVAASV
jgi:hypothetical protein